jgi:hypothetical protein
LAAQQEDASSQRVMRSAFRFLSSGPWLKLENVTRDMLCTAKKMRIE